MPASLVLQLGDGQLLQGGREDAEEAIADPFLVDYLVLAAAEHQPRTPRDLRGCRLGLDDVLLPPDVLEAVRLGVDEVARDAAREVQRGGRVLACCAMGLNRSGLVVGRTLRRLGIGGDEAVELVRRARGPRALSNRSFAQLVRA